MKIFQFYLFVFFCLNFFSCKKEETTSLDAFSFGTFYGECSGNCTIIYKIEGQNLYIDDMEYYSFGSLSFSNDALSAEKYQIAKKLMDDFPSKLLDSSERTYGCPDCGDQGGFFLEIIQNGNIETFHIDTYDGDQEQYLIDYKEKIRQTMQELI